MKLTPPKIKDKLKALIREMSNKPDAFVRNPGKDFSRKRKLTFEQMLQILICMGGNSIRKELLDWFGFTTDVATVSAFVQKREKILPSAVEVLFHRFVDACEEAKTYRGYRLLAADGSDLRLSANRADSASHIRNTSDTKGYNLMHLNAMYDLLRRVYVDATVQHKKGMNEHSALVTMVDRSEIKGNVIMMADRGYESFNNIAHLQEKGWNYIIRSKESYGIITNLPIPDEEECDIPIILTLTRRQTKETKALFEKYPERYRWLQTHTTFDYLKAKDDCLYDLNFRIVRFRLSDTAYETVFTNLDKKSFPADELKKLYKLRWGIETSFRELKYMVGLANLHSKKKDSIIQEIFANLIMYNFSELVASRAPLPKKYKGNARINFSAAVLICRRYFRDMLSGRNTLTLILKYISPMRPDRYYSRHPSVKGAVSFLYRIV